jgi:hypothetical protein
MTVVPEELLIDHKVFLAYFDEEDATSNRTILC